MKNNCIKTLTLLFLLIFSAMTCSAQSGKWFKAGPYYVDKQEMIRLMYKNMDRYMDHVNMRQKQRPDFRTCLGAFVTEIQKNDKLELSYDKKSMIGRCLTKVVIWHRVS